MNILKKHSTSDYINLLIAGFFMCISTILMVHDALLFKFNIYILIVINFLIWISCIKIFSNGFKSKIKKISIKEIVFSLIGLGYVLFLLGVNLKKIIFLIWSFLVSSFLYIIGLSERLQGIEELILMSILMVLINLLYYLLIKNLVNVRIFMFVIIYFVSQWNRYINSATVYLEFFLFGIILYVFFKNNYIFSLKNNSTISNKGSQFLFGVLIALGILSFSNVIVKTIPLDSLNARIGNMVPDISYLRDGYTNRGRSMKFDLTSTIYQPNSRKLGGSITLDKSVKLIVETSLPGTKLRGSVKDTYTGVGWIRSNKVLTKFEPKFLNLSLFKVKVNPVGINTSTLLTPLNTIEVKIASGNIEKNENDILNHKRSFIGKQLKEYTSYVLLNPIDNNLTDTQKEQYLQLPANYSKEVIDLTLGIIENKKSDKDKAEAIEFFLRNNYIYSLKVDDYGDEDFVKHFLIEGKKGYCTYFASAMVVMSRIADIPARYVEGFILPEQKNDKGIYRVTGDRGHAWPELYIEGSGWNTFEPTPAYNQDINVEKLLNDEFETDFFLKDSFTEKVIEVEEKEQKKNGSDLSAILLLLFFAGSAILIIVALKKNKIEKSNKLDFTKKQIATAKIYRIFRFGELFYKDLTECRLPEEKMKIILDKINYIEVNESVIINAMNIILFSEKDININNGLIIEGLEQALEKNIKQNVNIIRYTIYKYRVSDYK